MYDVKQIFRRDLSLENTKKSHGIFLNFILASNYTDKKQKLKIIYYQIAQSTGKQAVK